MSGWPKVAIRDVVRPVSTHNPARASASTNFLYIDLSAVDQDRKVIAEARQVACVDAPSRARQLVASDDVLVSTVRPNLNGVASVPKEMDGATASTGFCVLRPAATRIDAAYLFQWVKAPDFVADMVRKATGASYPAVSDRIVLESHIPLPPLTEQRRIAEVLDRADALRAKRRAALAQLDSLTQSIFLDMFGDPRLNPRDWKLYSLKELGRVKTGGTPSSTKSGMFDGPIPFVSPGDLESNNAVKRTLTEDGAAEVVTVREGSTFVCCIGATIGKMGKALARSAFNQQINAIEWAELIDDDFGLATLQFFKPQIANWGSSTTLPILKKSLFEQIEIPVPPLELQHIFGRRLSTVENLKTALRAALAELDALFVGLQHRAFRGQL